MPKVDYFLKFIEKLNRVIAAMMGFREKGFPEDALRLAEEAYTEMLSLDLQALFEMSNADFEALLAKYDFQQAYLENLAELLYQSANCYEEQAKKHNASVFYSKSLLCLISLTRKDKTFSLERESRIDELKARIENNK